MCCSFICLFRIAYPTQSCSSVPSSSFSTLLCAHGSCSYILYCVCMWGKGVSLSGFQLGLKYGGQRSRQLFPFLSVSSLWFLQWLNMSLPVALLGTPSPKASSSLGDTGLLLSRSWVLQSPLLALFICPPSLWIYS